MQSPEFELFCQLMYADYCDEKIFNKETVALRYSEYRIRNVQFLREEYVKKYGPISTIHSQE